MSPSDRSAASTDPHDLAVEYIERSISAQVALGYAAPSAKRRASAIAAAEREIGKLRGLQLRAMTPEELDEAEICRRCWESYTVCVCSERKARPYG